MIKPEGYFIKMQLPSVPSIGKWYGTFELTSQKAGHVPRPLGSFALISMTPYLNFFVATSLADVYRLPLLNRPFKHQTAKLLC